MDLVERNSDQGHKSDSFAHPLGAPSDPLEVSVVIPCLNEARSIALCIDKALAGFRTAGVQGEVVVADNGSTDGSMEIAQKRGARVVHVEARGYGNALRKGITEAGGKFVVVGDADDSYDFSEVPRFLAKWGEGFELVLGNRFEGEIKPGAMPWSHKYFGNPAITWTLNCLFHGAIGDAYCGMRGFSKALYERADMRCAGMEFALELVIKAMKLGASITEIPITLWPDKRGRPPHLRTFHDGWRSLRFMLLFAPNWLFLFPGTTLFLLGVAIVLWLLPGPRRLGRAEIDLHTMLFGVMFALTGAQIISIGLFAKGLQFHRTVFPESAQPGALVAPGELGTRTHCGCYPDAGGWFRGHWVALEMDRQRIWTLVRRSRRNFPFPLFLAGGTGYIYFVFHQHVGDQPRHLHWRLRLPLNWIPPCGSRSPFVNRVGSPKGPQVISISR